MSALKRADQIDLEHQGAGLSKQAWEVLEQKHVPIVAHEIFADQPWICRRLESTQPTSTDKRDQVCNINNYTQQDNVAMDERHVKRQKCEK